jgi:hypothetical protein
MTNQDNSDSTSRRANSAATPEDGQSLFEKVLPDGVRRGVESLLREGRLKQLVSEMKLPKEIVSHMISQIDEAKQAAVSAVSREVRLFLERTSLADELVKLLTQVSFQIKTEVRFVRTEESKNKGQGKGKERRRKGRWPLRPMISNEVATADSQSESASDDEENGGEE